MKKTLLCSALLTLICTQVQAEVNQQSTQPQTPGTVNTTVSTDQNNPAPTVIQNTNTQQVQNPQQNQTTPQNQGTQQNQTTPQNQGTQQNQTTPQNQDAQPNQTTQQNQTTVQPVTQQLPALQQEINCDYKIPAETKTIDQTLIMTWSQKAVTQAFDFDPATIDAQMQKLQVCFTDQGWLSFNSALQKSGNLDAIKSQKLTVSSQIDGQPQITEAKDNQWKITLPLQVVYQNDKEKVTQLLNVNVTVGRKISGDLGITQMIATPRTAVNADQNNAASTTTNTSTTTTPTDTVNTNSQGTPPSNSTPAN